MKQEEFYHKYANTRLEKRTKILSNNYLSPLLGMTLNNVYEEIYAIGNKLRSDEIRRDKLLEAVEEFLK